MAAGHTARVILFLLCEGGKALGWRNACSVGNRARQVSVVAAREEAAESSNAVPAIGTQILAEPVLRVAFQFREHRPLGKRIAAICGIDAVSVNNALSAGWLAEVRNGRVETGDCTVHT